MRAGLCCSQGFFISLSTFSMGNSYLSTTQAACQLSPSPCSLSLSHTPSFFLSFSLHPPSVSCCCLSALPGNTSQQPACYLLLPIMERETERCAGKRRHCYHIYCGNKKVWNSGFCKNATMSLILKEIVLQHYN